MLDANHMVIVNEDGEELEVEVLLTFEAEGSETVTHDHCE